MKILTEKTAEEFLSKNRFDVLENIYIEKESELKSTVNKIGFPCVMKVSSPKIIHKNQVGGVELDIGNLEEAIKVFKRIMKIKNAEGVLVQKQIEGEWYLLGIKKTPEFGHAIVFGAGGIYTEKIKDTSFRICPITKHDAKEMINETKAGKTLKNREAIIDVLIKLSELVEKYPAINELDINPLMIYKNKGVIVDARIVWD